MSHDRIIYSLACPITGNVHYIGKSTNGLIRPSTHLSDSHSDKIKRWVNELKFFGHKPDINILQYVSKNEDIDQVEDYYIKKFLSKGAYLLNISLVTAYAITPNLDEVDDTGIKSIAEFIKAKRSIMGITQRELAYRAGVGIRFVRDIEQCKKDNFHTESINRVLNLFGYKIGVVKSD
jgi:hypothetical protein